jgi:hypothetical protein
MPTCPTNTNTATVSYSTFDSKRECISFNPTTNKTIAYFSPVCPAGYTFNSNAGRCI